MCVCGAPCPTFITWRGGGCAVHPLTGRASSHSILQTRITESGFSFYRHRLGEVPLATWSWISLEKDNLFPILYRFYNTEVIQIQNMVSTYFKSYICHKDKCICRRCTFYLIKKWDQSTVLPHFTWHVGLPQCWVVVFFACLCKIFSKYIFMQNYIFNIQSIWA